MAKQTTITSEITLKGVGIHTGEEVTMTFKPAPANHGYAFQRIDLEGNPIIEAHAQYVADTQRGTSLQKNGVTIQTSEHVLAALVGCEVDNVLIELNASEPPIMDGSSKFFVEAIEKVGLEELDAEREEYIVKENITYTCDESGSEITLLPADGYEVTTMVDFGTKVLGTQNASLKTLSQFKNEFANARTFSFLHELENLLSNGLIKGGDLNNAIVYVDKELSEETMDRLRKAFNKKSISVKPNGILDNLTLHYPNEAARHKLLDVIGDLALIGTRIRGKVIASEPALDVNQIMDILPHRPPFLLVDKILEISKKHVVAVKSVTMNEPFFQGHFPGQPVMPGVLQIEAMAQAGGVLVLNSVPDPENYLTFFMKIENAKFKHPVVPGDTLVFKLELLSPIRRGICHMQAYAYSRGRLTTEAEMMAQIVKKNQVKI